MFFINPVLIFVFWALKDFWKKYRYESIILGIIFFAHVLLYSNRGPGGFSGSSAWGIRYMVPMAGFMVIVMGIFVDKIIGTRSLLFKIFVIVFAISIAFQYVGVSNVYLDTQNYLDERYNTPEDKWAARKVMNMNPRWNLITENLKKIKHGDVDLLYVNYFFRKDVLPESILPVKWIGVVPLFLVCFIIISDYLLLKTLRPPSTEPVKRKQVRGVRATKGRRNSG